MEPGARARGLAGCARGRALGDGLCGRSGARCAILIGSSAIKNPRMPQKPHATFFSNRPKIADLRAAFSHLLRSKNHDSRGAYHATRFTNHQSLRTNHAIPIVGRNIKNRRK